MTLGQKLSLQRIMTGFTDRFLSDTIASHKIIWNLHLFPGFQVHNVAIYKWVIGFQVEWNVSLECNCFK